MYVCTYDRGGAGAAADGWSVFMTHLIGGETSKFPQIQTNLLTQGPEQGPKCAICTKHVAVVSVDNEAKQSCNNQCL